MALSTANGRSRMMNLPASFFFGACALILVALNAPALAQDAAPQSKAERNNYEETSLYDDVIAFFRDLELQTPLMRIQMFGKTNEGRELPLVTISNPPVSTPREALASGKPI